MNTILRYIMAIASLLWWGIAYAQTCTIGMTDASGRQGNTTTVQVTLANTAPVADMQMDLRLPDGLGMDIDRLGKPVVRTTDRTAAHSLSTARIGANTWRIVAVSLGGQLISAGDGAILEIAFDMSGAPGSYTAQLSDIHLSTDDATDIKVSDTRCSVTITDSEVPVEAVTLSAESLTLEQGGVAVITAQCTPADATAKALIWTSSDESVLVVNRGFITAIAPGTAAVTAAAANGVTATCNVTVTPTTPKTISLVPSKLSLAVGATAKLVAVISPDDASDTTVSWTVDETAVATVDAGGNVHAVAPGAATVTATTANGLTATAVVEVKAADTNRPTMIQLSQSEVTLYPGCAVTIHAQLWPKPSVPEALTWTSSDIDVATVVDGRITAKALGSAVITASTSYGLSARCAVTVSAQAVASDYALTASAPITVVGEPIILSVCLDNTKEANDLQMAITLPEGLTPVLDAKGRPSLSKSARLSAHNVSASYRGNTVTIAAVSLSSSPVAGDSGELFSLALESGATGTYVVQIDNVHISDNYAHDTAVEACHANIEVKSPETVQPDAVTINPSRLTLPTGGSFRLTCVVDAAPSVSPAITWSAEPEDVAAIDQNGVVTALKAGVATVTATCNGVSAACEVTVEDVEATAIELSTKTLLLTLGRSERLQAIFTPANTTDQQVEWQSSDTSIAEVSADGTVKAMGMGSATITATHSSGLAAECAVMVTFDPSNRNFAITAPDMEGEAGEAAEIVLTLDNSQPVRSLQFVLTLPEGMTLDADISDCRTERLADFEVYTSTSGSDIMIMAVSLSGDVITDLSGALFTLPVTLPPTPGTKSLTVTDAHITDYGYRDIELPATTVNIKVTPVGGYELGDVNHDSVITVGDIVLTVAHILGQSNDDFDEYCADLNGDGLVTVTDVVSIVGLILSR